MWESHGPGRARPPPSPLSCRLDLDCTTPLPDQRDLSAEEDCQRAIGKAGVKYLVTREKILEKCALAGGTRANCLADALVQLLVEKAVTKKDTAITNKCGGRIPSPTSPFCCKTGGLGNACMAEPDRAACTAGGGQVQEEKTCNGGTNTCDPVQGPNKPIIWWGFCPETDTCPGTALSTLDELIDCVDSSADAVADELLCLQFRSGWPCPADAP